MGSTAGVNSMSMDDKSPEGIYAWDEEALNLAKDELNKLKTTLSGISDSYSKNIEVVNENLIVETDKQEEGGTAKLINLMTADVTAINLLMDDISTLIGAVSEAISIYSEGEKEIEDRCEDVRDYVKNALSKLL